MLQYALKLKFLIIMVVLLVEELFKNKPGNEKKEEAVTIIKEQIDKNIFDVPDEFDCIEESIIRFVIDYTVKAFNASGIFSKAKKE